MNVKAGAWGMRMIFAGWDCCGWFLGGTQPPPIGKTTRHLVAYKHKSFKRPMFLKFRPDFELGLLL
jgi:hypothetical protein